MLHIIRVLLQQGLEAGMAAEGVPGQFFTDETRALDPGGLIGVRG
jgi:hypothetical protein